MSDRPEKSSPYAGSMTFKKIVRSWTPPIVLKLSKRAIQNKPTLFDGHTELFFEELSGAAVYGEYGMGLSTQWVYAETELKIVSVESSLEWFNSTRDSIGASERCVFLHFDLGPVGSWGYPTGYSKRDSFPNYIISIWQQRYKPDVVLIDGRFRVACFAQSVLMGEVGTRIIFDDYTEREHYQIVAELLEPEKILGRQALFVIPPSVNELLAHELIRDFTHVRE